jgi:hypothetical protein
MFCITELRQRGFFPNWLDELPQGLFGAGHIVVAPNQLLVWQCNDVKAGT